jgi:hypothetical protein
MDGLYDFDDKKAQKQVTSILGNGFLMMKNGNLTHSLSKGKLAL